MKDLFKYLLNSDFLKESNEERYDYKRFQACDKKFLRFMGINSAKEWNALPKKRKDALLKEMQY